MPKLKEANINTLIQAQPIYLYDMSIEDVQERVAKRLTFPTVTAAANFLGYVPNKLADRIGVGRYVYHKVNGTKYAARKAKI